MDWRLAVFLLVGPLALAGCASGSSQDVDGDAARQSEAAVIQKPPSAEFAHNGTFDIVSASPGSSCGLNLALQQAEWEWDVQRPDTVPENLSVARLEMKYEYETSPGFPVPLTSAWYAVYDPEGTMVRSHGGSGLGGAGSFGGGQAVGGEFAWGTYRGDARACVGSAPHDFSAHFTLSFEGP